jgi:hypothetical protein
MARIAVAFQRIVPNWSYGLSPSILRIDGIRTITNWTVVP